METSQQVDPFDRPSARGVIGRSTPAWFRLLSILVVAAIAVSGAVSFLAAKALTDRAVDVEDSTAPVVIASQELFSAIAEADSASTAVFLSGSTQDRSQQRVYEAALARAATKVEEVARLIGDDTAAHAALERVSVGLVGYAGAVERARLSNLAGDPAAAQELNDNIATVRTAIVPDLEAIGATAQQQLSSASDRDSGWVIAGAAATILALVAVLAGHRSLARRTRRILHPLLLAAGAILAVSLVWLSAAALRQNDDFRLLDEQGAQSIVNASEMQSAGFARKTIETVAALNGVPATDLGVDPILGGRELDSVLTDLENGRYSDGSMLIRAAEAADGPVEAETVRELAIRWDRYLSVSSEIAGLLDTGDVAGAQQRFASANDAFTGFNVTAERVFLGNRDQVFASASAATQRTRYLRVGVVIAAIVAALCSMLAFQIRINDYR